MLNQYSFQELREYFLKSHTDSLEERKTYYVSNLHSMVAHRCHIPDRGDVTKIIAYFLLGQEIE